jgi:DeoR/GlpR family transcriptional regulator of sugar metabolism
VTEVTIRRDLKRLEDNKLLKRTFGGAVSLERTFNGSPSAGVETVSEPSLPETDALIITSIRTRDAHTLRERAIRQQIPLIAEGDPQKDAVYVGIDNYKVAYELGEWTGGYFRQHHPDKTICLLDIGLNLMPTTTLRSEGFLDGIAAAIGERITSISVDGGGTYNHAYHMATDALRLHPEINIIFGINDDSILAGIQAYYDLGRDSSMLVAVAIGGEGKTIFNTLMQQGPLKACMAMFPEVTGRLIIDTVLYLWQDNRTDFNVITPTELLTAENIQNYYIKQDNEWQFNHDALIASVERPWNDESLVTPATKNKHISFSITFRTHEWYQNLTRAMQARAQEVGAKFSVVDVNENIRAEVHELRRVIGKIAAAYVKEGDTIILDAGTTTVNMTQFLKQHRNITVITNSPDIFENLRANQDIQLILAGGEFDRQAQAFVGRNVYTLFEEMKVDKAFIIAGGLSASFGLSSVHRSEAEVRRYMIQAAREVVVLADHTVLDVDSDHQVTSLTRIDTLVTDMGILSSQKLAYAQLGLKLLIAGQVSP